AVGGFAEPVDVVDAGQLGGVGGFADRQPVGEVVAHVVAAERQHRERVVAQLADLAFGGGGLLRGDAGAEEDAVLPVEGFGDQGDVGGAPAAEQDGGDGYAGRVLPLGGDDRALRRGGGEPGVGVRGGFG